MSYVSYDITLSVELTNDRAQTRSRGSTNLLEMFDPWGSTLSCWSQDARGEQQYFLQAWE